MSNNELVLAALEHARPMLLNMAYRYALDFEDLYQEAAIKAMEATNQLPSDYENPIGYLIRAIRNRVMALVRKHDYHQKSLDTPFSDDNDTTLADLLAAPIQAPHDHEREDSRDLALFAALHRLPLDEQLYMQEVHQLNAFTPLPPDQAQKHDSTRPRDVVCHRALYHLRHDTKLQADLGMHVKVKAQSQKTESRRVKREKTEQQDAKPQTAKPQKRARRRAKREQNLCCLHCGKDQSRMLPSVRTTYALPNGESRVLCRKCNFTHTVIDGQVVLREGQVHTGEAMLDYQVAHALKRVPAFVGAGGI